LSSVAVGAVVAGWALAQSPRLLPGLTVRQAAASHDTMVAVIVAVLAGGALLLPSLATLFRLALGGRLGEEHEAVIAASEGPPVAALPAPRVRLLGRVALALLVAGVGLVNVADAEWAHVIGAACFVAFVAAAFRVVVPLGVE
jgi:cytochrome d ubiquinol oxidase subunit II